MVLLKKSWSQQMCRWQEEWESFSRLSREDNTEVLLRPVVFISGVLYASGRGTGLAGSRDRRQGEGRSYICISLGFHTSLENGLTVFIHSRCSARLCQEGARNLKDGAEEGKAAVPFLQT